MIGKGERGMVKKISGKATSVGGAALLGMVLGVVWTLVSAMGIAKLVDMEVLPMENVGYGSMAAVLSAVFVSASLAGRKAGHMVVQAAVMAGGAYFLCLLLVNALFFGGNFVGLGVTFLLVLIAIAAAILAAGRGRSGRHRRRYKIPGK